MVTSQRGIELIKKFEGLRTKAYRDIIGVLTIGFGHTGLDVYENEIISEEEAEQLLRDDLVRFELGISKLVKVSLNQNQFDALVSFTFNVGLGNFNKSHLLIHLNNSQYETAANEFLKWDRAGGIERPDLKSRREQERQLFLS